eukprot:gene6715-35341_t
MNDPKRLEDAHPVDAKKEGLRRVEIDVLIPKMMKASAQTACDDQVRAFNECCKGRIVSMVWACRDIHANLDACIREHLTDADFNREKELFVRKRNEHHKKLAEEGDQGFQASAKSESNF